MEGQRDQLQQVSQELRKEMKAEGESVKQELRSKLREQGDAIRGLQGEQKDVMLRLQKLENQGSSAASTIWWNRSTWNAIVAV